MTSVLPKIARLSSRVWRILGCNPGPMTLQGTNVYLVGTGQKRILIDAGEDGFPDYVQNLKQLLQDENACVKDLILTHWHRDHVGALEDLLPIFKSSSIGLPRVYKFSTEEKREINIPADYEFQLLQDSQEFNSEGTTLRVLQTPGHTTDHACLLLEEEKILFSGDCILGEGTAVFEDLYTYMKSLDRILEVHPTFIYPSHGPVIEDPVEKIKYYIHHRKERERQIMDFLGSANAPVTSMDIVKGVYTTTPEALYPAAEYNVSHHLTKLVKENLVRESDGKYSSVPKGKM